MNLYGVTIFFWLFCFGSALKVLMYVPTLSYSHVAFSGRLADLLAASGHDVTILLIEIDPAVRDAVSKSAEVIHVNVELEDGRMPRTLWQNPGPYEDATPTNPVIVAKLVKMSIIFKKLCQELMRNRTLLAELRSRRFDVGIAEQYSGCGFGVFQLAGVPSTIWLSATAIHRPQTEAMGIVRPLSYVPDLLVSQSSKMNLVQRIRNIVVAKAIDFLNALLLSGQEAALVRHAAKQFNTIMDNNSDDDLTAVAARSRALLANILPLLDFAAPTASFVHSIAGMTVDMNRVAAESRLSTVWQRILHTSNNASTKRRFVIVTFGSIAKTSDMPADMRRSLFEALRKFSDLNFIVKFERAVRSDDDFVEIFGQNRFDNCTESLTNDRTIQRIADNVFLAKWIPQMDLIAHPLCLAVLTHGGWSSVLEAVFYGRPLVLMPLFADHFKNAKVIEHRKLGVLLDKHDIRRDSFVNALRQVVEDESIGMTAQKYSRMLRDYAVNFAPPRLLVNHVLQGIQLQPQVQSQSRIPYNDLDMVPVPPSLKCSAEQLLWLTLNNATRSPGKCELPTSSAKLPTNVTIGLSASRQPSKESTESVRSRHFETQTPKFARLSSWTANALDLFVAPITIAFLVTSSR